MAELSTHVGDGLVWDNTAKTIDANVGSGAGTLCAGNDARLSDARTPSAHAASHLPGGSDALTTAAAVANPPGTANAAGVAASFARSDHTHALAAFGTGAGTFCQGNDSRLTDSRTPTAHAASHLPGGSDALTTAAAVANPPGTANAAGSAASFARSDHTHALAAFGTGAGTFCQGNDSRLTDSRTPTAHAASHLPGGSDALTTAAAVANPPGTANGAGSATSFARSDHTHALAAFGTSSGTFCEGNDSRVTGALNTAAVFRLMTLRVL